MNGPPYASKQEALLNITHLQHVRDCEAILPSGDRERRQAVEQAVEAARLLGATEAEIDLALTRRPGRP